MKSVIVKKLGRADQLQITNMNIPKLNKNELLIKVHCYWNKILKSIKKEGRWILIGILGGFEIEKVNLMSIISKRIEIISTLSTPRNDKYKEQLTKEFYEKVIPFFERKEIKPIIDSEFSLNEIKKAHLPMENNENIGKIIINVF